MLPKFNLDAAFKQKDKIAKAVERRSGKATSAFGYQIVKALIVNIEPSANVKEAMDRISEAARMRVAAKDKAEAEKILQIKKAEGEAESKYLAGVGMARNRNAICYYHISYNADQTLDYGKMQDNLRADHNRLCRAGCAEQNFQFRA